MNNEPNWEAWIPLAVEAALAAGKEIMDVYGTEFSVNHKSDHSPVTEADLRAHNVIAQRLETTGLPILSEEGTHLSYEERQAWEYFWVVDPLDGTKEFVNRRDSFAVNIALMHKDRPIGGLIFVPARDELYLASPATGPIKISQPNWQGESLTVQRLVALGTTMPIPTDRKHPVIAVSFSHPSKETQDYIDEMTAKNPDTEVLRIGSAYKIALVAEGSVDVFPRFGPTMEWDTASGQAILEAVGKELIDWKTKAPMVYNRENLTNNWFVAS